MQVILPLWNTFERIIFLDANVSPFSASMQAAALILTLFSGISDLYRHRKVQMNLTRAATSLSVFATLVSYNVATYFIISPALYEPSLGHRIFFAIYLSISLYNIVSSLFYFMHIAGAIEKPEKYSSFLLVVFPVLFAVTYFSKNLVFPVCLTNVLIIVALTFMSYLVIRAVYLKKVSKININYFLFCSVLIAAYGFRIYGIQVLSADILVTAYLACVYALIYLFFLQFYFPGFSWKSSSFHNGEAKSDSIVLAEESDDDILEAKSSQKKNLLEGADLQIIENRIDKFVQERIFLDEEIRLPDFAAYLGLTVHQASYYLNQYKKLNFPEFINYHRFEEAKNMILKESNLNLLEIALACGFNSPSSFHRASVKFAGVSPRDLKREIQNEILPDESFG
ncbi:AraC family transcriptional regulator [Leptospira yasudae]|uniref:AraC family transcriptional regulator n=1 Tax=Leptospira yasudae TaxID=2202201 RepID=UPI001C4EF810|nr:helix-turn-helix domain-containing protein [Leptospira yasudae]MBW0432315.1 AraC family transcriptional regulator [Leptospira yasudae]